MNAWQFEVDGSKTALNDGYHIIGTTGTPEEDYVIHSAECVRRGKTDKPLAFHNPTCKKYDMRLDQNIILEMQEKGII